MEFVTHLTATSNRDLTSFISIGLPIQKSPNSNRDILSQIVPNVTWLKSKTIVDQLNDMFNISQYMAYFNEQQMVVSIYDIK